MPRRKNATTSPKTKSKENVVEERDERRENLDEQNHVSKKQKANTTPAIEVKQLSFSYETGPMILKDITFTLERGFTESK